MPDTMTIKQKLALIDKLSEKLDKERKTTNSLVCLDKKTIVPVPAIPTGCPTFDYDLAQFGGIPRGRVVEIFGPESAGKTTTTLQIIAAAQRAGGLALFVDAEHALDPVYAQDLGVDMSRLVINQPDSGEQALQVVREVAELNGAVDLIVVDSAAALVPEAELAGEIGDAHVGLQARLMSQSLRILTPLLANTGTTLIFINQIREKIGVMYGNPETTPTGRALKFYSSLRLKVRRGKAITPTGKADGAKAEKIIGHELIIKAEKNKGGIPFRETTLDLIYPGEGREAGFDKFADTVTYATQHGLFEMKGSWYWMDLGNLDEKKKPIGPERLANGLDNLITYLRTEPKTMALVNKKIAEHVKSLVEGKTDAQNSVVAV